MGIDWNPISMERLERPQQLNKKFEWLVQIEICSILRRGKAIYQDH